MTVIAFDGRYVAADRALGANGDMRYFRPAVKLRQSEKSPGLLFGICGAYAWLDPWIQWHEAGKDPHALPVCPVGKDPCQFLVFRQGDAAPTGAAYSFGCPYPQTIDEPDAWGTGQEFAIGAMDAGLCARDAVIIAASRDKHSGNGVLTYDLRTMSWIVEDARTARYQTIAKAPRMDRERDPEA